ncbi:hypothetical protein QCA50_012669 [Cerrena zonata]|uniref:Uncharacterized protein n=1 Tax=Cerrena zonata TaxID=2478898 RepID=A0AAW0FSP3_9APHY
MSKGFVATKINWNIITRWARLSLPNGQIAHSAWKETAMKTNPQIARMVKLRHQNNDHFAEIHFYFCFPTNGQFKTLTLMSLFGEPDRDLLQHSQETLVVCEYRGNTALLMVEITQIVAVVAVPPLPKTYNIPSMDTKQLHYVVEKPGLDILHIGGHNEEDIDE